MEMYDKVEFAEAIAGPITEGISLGNLIARGTRLAIKIGWLGDAKDILRYRLWDFLFRWPLPGLIS